MLGKWWRAKLGSQSAKNNKYGITQTQLSQYISTLAQQKPGTLIINVSKKLQQRWPWPHPYLWHFLCKFPPYPASPHSPSKWRLRRYYTSLVAKKLLALSPNCITNCFSVFLLYVKYSYVCLCVQMIAKKSKITHVHHIQFYPQE